MRQLRFVTLSEDGTTLLVETSDGTEQFALTVDAALRDAARSDLPRLSPPVPATPPAPKPEPAATEPAIGPREIQIRVRAGEPPEELAAAHGMSLERLMRFAGPVLEERRRIADEARRARARR
ncbi:MAG: DUF3071 domain-containing protein, partial [Microbacterium sp.]|nr:DUF3071 domain-containing protein [Microbacterium sp.]